MDETYNGAGGTPAGDRLDAAIARLNGVLEVLDDVGVPLACAYVDLALSLCREELARREMDGS